jgi:hypothetical protein
LLVFLGIDPGWSGSVLAIDKDRKVLGHIENYKNEEQFCDAWKGFHETVLCGLKPSDIFAGIELVHANKIWGCVQNFNFGRSFAAARTLLYSYKIPFQEVTPQAWQKEMIGPKKQKEKRDTKALARLVVSRVWRDFDALDHTGCVDALLIAEHTRRRFVLDQMVQDA